MNESDFQAESAIDDHPVEICYRLITNLMIPLCYQLSKGFAI
jgi:hypothetical protein